MAPMPLPWEDDKVAMGQAELSMQAEGCREDWLRLARTYPRRTRERREALEQAAAWERRAALHEHQALYLTESWGQA